ncbi:MAG: tRNA (N(6)-L-threonylcarbamoyladenosine(37)-C(2))-methylthiotransferase MtaB [Candidatus Omnitrophica bacterium]|nr:tRNA (N(6)-L-threonylcarbamoyladenosine(37)-C(2))-methylthiotransferase MtaB [Candidatus Omnitrophota bacterium]
MKTIKFYTLGCKVNQYDTQSLREDFLRRGFKEFANGKAADIYVINTCTVTARADSESLGFVRKARRENPAARIIVTGCLAELDARKIEQVDKNSLIVRNRDKESIIQRLTTNDQRLTTNGISHFKGHTRAFLKIQDGCDNFCSYCKVPLVRGRSRSKPLMEIVSEARDLVKSGFKEIVLTGICLGSYGKDLKPEIGLVNLIEELEKIGQLLRIRLSSIEAADISEALILKLSRSKKLCRHLHIPIQSGDDNVLKDMHRRYTRADYLNLIKKIKRKIPGVAITTDVLVGFPGELQGNFENTMDLVKKIMPLKVHIFPYSRREGTFAAQDRNKEVPVHMIRERLLTLKKLADTCAMDYKKQFLGKKMEVLFEEGCKDSPGWWQGHTDNYILVRFRSGRNLKNRLIKVPVDFR